MPLPLFFPRVQYVPKLPRSGAVALDELCESAWTVCGGVGAWAKRLVVVIDAETDEAPWIRAEPGGSGAVEIGVPPVPDPVQRARWALGALAFSSLFDRVARATLRGRAWARIDGENFAAASAPKPWTATGQGKSAPSILHVLQRLAQGYPDMVCIGRMASYLHAVSEGRSVGVAPNHADLYAPLSTISDLRFEEELSAGRKRPRRLEFHVDRVPIGIYAEDLSGLPISYESVATGALHIAGVRVASEVAVVAS